MIGPARVAAFDILSAVSAGRVDLPTAIAVARANLADDRDRALAAEIATGVYRWRGAIDHLIATFSSRSLDRLDPEIVEILRLSIFQLLHLTRVPAAAVVDDAVDLAKRARKRSAAGLVNGVLRAVSRERRRLPLPSRPTDGARDATLDYLSVTLSHPRWLASRWLDRLGFDAAERWMLFNNRPAPLVLRANRFRISPEELERRLAALDIRTSRTQFSSDGLVVAEGQPLANPIMSEGLFVAQDEASQLVALLAGANPGRLVLDACAAPGGKTTAMAAVASRGRVVAADVRPRRIALLRRTVAAMGAANVAILQADALQPLPFAARFDCVLVDAPCSGLGTLRREPEIRWRRREEELVGLAAAERRMLEHAAAVVAPGGRLVYATCSSEPEENEHVVDAFLSQTSGFRQLDARDAHPALPSVLVDRRGHFRTTPDAHGLEGFFGAVFTRVQS
jgi:16S rRNA (cytosine967-C5)-methyltransferase